MSQKAGGVFQFGDFQIDALARTLRREGAIVTLNYRVFDVLLYLVQNPGKALTRDELLKNVWPDTFVDESSLVQSISVLRRALRGEARRQQIYRYPAGARVSVCFGSAGCAFREWK